MVKRFEKEQAMNFFRVATKDITFSLFQFLNVKEDVSKTENVSSSSFKRNIILLEIIQSK